MSVELDGANNIVKTDTISEVTSANGVTVDGLSIKDSKLVTADSVIEANMSANSVDSDSYVDGSIDTAHIAADAITGAKIADDAINSEHYTDGSIDTAHLADGQVTIGKLATAVLTGATDIGAAIADADLLLVDDGAGGTLRKTAASRIKTYVGNNTPTWDARASANQTGLSSGGWTKVQFDTELFDVGGGYDNTNDKFVVPSGEGGKYLVFAAAKLNPGNSSDLIGSGIRLTVGGTNVKEEIHFMSANPSDSEGKTVIAILDLSATHEVEVYVYNQTGNGSNGTITGSSDYDTYFSGFKLIE